MAFTGGVQQYFPFAPGIGEVVVPGAVTDVTATLPIISSGGTTPNISLQIPLPIVDGGTGTATPALVAGTNVTITGAWPDQTINAMVGAAGVASVTASSPLSSTGGSNPNISITSPLPIANGGTGTATPNLIAGVGISITGSWPNETISTAAGAPVTSVTGSGNILSSGGTTPNITTVTNPTFASVLATGSIVGNTLGIAASAGIGTSLTVGSTIAALGKVTAPLFGSPNSNGILGTFNVMDFGATGNGSTNDTTALQNAINACGTAGGGTVWLPHGTYKTTSTLNIASPFIRIAGASFGGSVIAPASTTTDWILITTSQTEITSLSIIGPVTQTAGAAIHQTGVQILTNVNNILIARAYNGFLIESGASSGSTFYILNVYIEFCGNAGVYCGNNTVPFQGLVMINVSIGQCGYGVWLENISGGNFIMVSIIQCIDGFVLNPGSTEYNVFLFFSQCQSDSNTNIGWLFGGSGPLNTIMCENCWTSANASHGILLNSSNITGLVWNNGIIQANQQYGMFGQLGSQVSFSNNQIYNNGRATANTYDGIVMGAGMGSFILANNFSGIGGNFGGANNQRYGINVVGPGNNHYVVTGNVLQGNLSGGLHDAGTGAQKYVAGNIT